MLKSASGKQMLGDIVRRKRYFYALLMILLMIGAAELLNGKGNYLSGNGSLDNRYVDRG